MSPEEREQRLDVRFATCPACRMEPLRFVRTEAGGVYVCPRARCGFSSARDALVEALVFELADVHRLLEDFARIAVPAVIKEEFQRTTLCEECNELKLAEVREVVDPGSASRSNGRTP